MRTDKHTLQQVAEMFREARSGDSDTLEDGIDRARAAAAVATIPDSLFRSGTCSVLEDELGGASWWCGICGARSAGRILPSPTPARVEASRLASAHMRAYHR